MGRTSKISEHKTSMETGADLSCVPTEILSKIFKFLSFIDLANAILVSKLWKEVAEDPWLWRDFPLNMKSIEMVKIRRFTCARNININVGSITSEDDAKCLFSVLEKNMYVKNLNLNHIDIKSVCPKIVTMCINKLEKVKNLELSESQALQLFSVISVNTRLKEVDICSTNFESIPLRIFSQAIRKLDRLNLKFSVLTKQQIEIMFEAITEDKREKDLDIAGTANLYKMNVSGFAPYVSGFAPYERRVKKLSRISKRKRNWKFRRPMENKHPKIKRREMQGVLQAMSRTSVA